MVGTQLRRAGRWALVLPAILLLSASACELPQPPPFPEPEPQPLPVPPDSGLPPPPPPQTDAGVVTDAGEPPPPPPGDTARVPCDPALQEGSPDAGAGTTYLEICVGTRTVGGFALVDGLPTTAPLHLAFRGASGESRAQVSPDVNGAWSLGVLRGLYDELLLWPSAMADPAATPPTLHEGMLPLGAVDLREDATRDFAIDTGLVEGVVTIDGVPIREGAAQPNLKLVLPGNPTQQAGRTFTPAGAYSLRFYESQSVMRLSLSREVLGEVELSDYRYGSILSVGGAPVTQDFALHTAKLSANLSFDGVPLPERRLGDEYRLELIQAGQSVASVFAWHDVRTGARLNAAIPRGTYGVNLYLVPVVDRTYPSYLYNFPLRSSVDLSVDRTVDFDITTVSAEGGISLDGVAVTPDPTQRWQLYAYGYGNPDGTSFVSMYDVPFESAGFNLRMVPSKNFYLLFYLTPAIESRLPTGWYLIDQAREILTDVALPIDIPTQEVSGEIRVPRLSGGSGTAPFGRLTFSGEKGSFHLDVTNTDGHFDVRLPQATYRIYFDPEPARFPTLASGRYLLASNVVVDGTGALDLPLVLPTAAVAGPVRIDSALLPDSLPNGPEARLVLERFSDGATFRVPVAGGASEFHFHAQPGRYAVSFELLQGALANTASGHADLALDLLIPEPTPDAMDGGTPP